MEQGLTKIIIESKYQFDPVTQTFLALMDRNNCFYILCNKSTEFVININNNPTVKVFISDSRYISTEMFRISPANFLEIYKLIKNFSLSTVITFYKQSIENNSIKNLNKFFLYKGYLGPIS